MRLSHLGNHQRTLLRGSAVILVGLLAAGCSSDVMRFEDSIFTGSSRTSSQSAPVQQAYPGDAQLDQTYTGSVSRSAARPSGILHRAGLIPRPQADIAGGAAIASAVQNPYPVGQSDYRAPVQPAYPAVASAPIQAVPLPPASSIDTTMTGTTAPAQRSLAVAAQPMPQASAPAAEPAPVVAKAEGGGGWTRAGGTQVTVKQGETVHNLSRRFGVPADAIIKTNGLSGPTLVSGQSVVIPAYVHAAKAPAIAGASAPQVADATSKASLPSNKIPVPGQAPAERVAILPGQPKVKEPEAAPQTAAADQARDLAPAGNTYTVVSGDTLNGIARKTGASVEALRQANGLSSGLIRIGQTLTIPAGGAASQVQMAQAKPAKVDPTTTATTPAPEVAAYTPPQKTESVIQQVAVDNDAQAPDATGIGKMRWPVRGRVISEFGAASGGKKNDGIDIAVPSGTAVKAAENGVVIYAGDGLKEFGNTVLVRHENGLVTVYGHASELKVQRGQQVKRGDEIALAGMSGSAETPKLHFEVRKDSTPVNPSGFLE